MRRLLPLLLVVTACSTPPESAPAAEILDGRAVEDGVRKILSDRYAQEVDSVTCPDKQDVKAGNTFTCDVNVDGEQRKVTIRIRSEAGDYEVSPAR